MFSLVLLLLLAATVRADTMPQSIHVSMFNDAQTNAPRIVLAWITMGMANTSAKYGPSASQLTSEVSESATPLRYDTDAGFNHFVILPPVSWSRVFYQVGSQSGGWSPVLELRNPAAVQDSFRAWVCADLGIDNAAGTIAAINRRAPEVDLYVHAGDISYANDHVLKYESWWRQWFGLIANATSSAPYMAAPGNHEVWCRCAELLDTLEFGVYKHKFLFPGSPSTNPARGSGDNMWYSFDMGPVHFVSFSSESGYPGAPIDVKKKRSSSSGSTTQLEWLENDLSNVNRSATPFVIVFAHRPYYANEHSQVNYTSGTPLKQAAKVQAAFEDLFQKHGVDVFLAGHVHGYQRTFPVFKNRVNSSGLVEIIAGAGGSAEGLSKEGPASLPWLAFMYNEQEGYGLLDANRTHLVWNYYSSGAGKPEKLIDTTVIASKY